MSKSEVQPAPIEQFESLKNWSRWGDADERGTVNYIDHRKVLSALAIPRYGVSVGLGRDLFVGRHDSDQVGQFSSETFRASPEAVHDEWRLRTHGFGMTHLDALGHTIFDGIVYGGRQVDENLSDQGLEHGSIMAFGSGIVTRGVLLDVAAAKGLAYLEQGHGVSAADLESAAAAGHVSVEPGDAVFVRVGLGRRRAERGFDGDENRTGVLPDVTEWLHDRRVAIYSGDCIERLPSDDANMTHPLHQVGQVAMGLCTLDIPEMERLSDACGRYSMAEFLLVVSPLRVHGASGSPVNPIAVF